MGKDTTYARRRRANIVEKKPIPAYRRTLPQMYQRWDYQDAIFYWKALSDAQKAVWETNARPHHMTGFAYYMSYYLTNLPDLAGRWHLDGKAGALAKDFSKNENDGTIIGASPAVGLIDGCLNFDGLNDYVIAPYKPSLSLANDWTLEAFVRQHVGQADVSGNIIHRWFNYHLIVTNTQTIYTGFYDGLGWKSGWFANSVALDAWTHLAAVWDNTAQSFDLYFNGDLDVVRPIGSSPDSTTIKPLCLGTLSGHNANWFKGDIDHATVYNSKLDPILIKRHSERRYPL